MRGARAAEASAASDRAARLAVDIAGKVLARLPNSTRVDGFVDGLAEALASLPEASRDEIRRRRQAAANGGARADP